MIFELKRPNDYSDNALLNEIRRVAQIVDKPITKTKFDKESKYSTSTIEKRFGGWISALQNAGLDESFWHTQNVEITKVEILDELKRVSENIKSHSFSMQQFAENSSMTKYVFKGNNSFNQLMKLAGLEVPKKSRKYRDIDCFENLLKVWTFYGRQPNYSEMSKRPSSVGPKAYVSRWGSWTKALVAFVEQVNFDMSDIVSESDYIELNNAKIEQKKKLSAEDRREIPIGLRFNILKRDNYKCVICGRSPATTLGIELHVDHIYPFSKGRKTRMDNLRTLCNECNIGKSNKI